MHQPIHYLDVNMGSWYIVVFSIRLTCRCYGYLVRNSKEMQGLEVAHYWVKKKKIALSTGGFRGSDLLVNLGGKWKLREESIVKGEKKKNTSVIKLSKKRKGFWRACIALTTTTSRSSIQFNFLGTYHEGIHCFIPSLLTNLLQDAS